MQPPLLRTRLLPCGYGDATVTKGVASPVPSSGPAAVLQSLFQGRLSCSLASHLDCFWDLSIEIPGAARQRRTDETVDDCQEPDKTPSLDAPKSGGTTDAVARVDKDDDTTPAHSAPCGGDHTRVGAPTTPVVDVKMALRNFCAPEMIDKRETRLSIWGDPPPILTLHLKRFWQSQDEEGQWRFHKIDAPVQFKESKRTTNCTSMLSGHSVVMAARLHID